MKKLLFLLLCGAAVLDITQQVYSTDLVGSIAHRASGTNIFGVIANSSIMTTLEHWALFLLGFGALSFAMSFKRPNRPDVIG